jgi:hypothetical protein
MEGPREQDSSDEEWKVEWENPLNNRSLQLDLETYICGMVQHAFQQVDEC